MAVSTGLQVMNANVEAACGPKGKHDPGRSAVRHGSEDSDGDGSNAGRVVDASLSGRLEPVGQQVEPSARATGKSTTSRRLVAATDTALGDRLAAPLHDLDLLALMSDGVHFGDHLCVVALGVGIDGVKHPSWGPPPKINGKRDNLHEFGDPSDMVLPGDCGSGSGWRPAGGASPSG